MRVWGAVLLAAVLASGAGAEEAHAPETSLSPEARPDSVVSTPTETTDVAAPEESAEENSDGANAPAASENDVTVIDSGPPLPARIAAEEDGLAACRAELTKLGVTFENVPAVTDPKDADCGIENPLRVTALPGDVALEPAGIMRCETALALARWSKNHVAPAAAHLPDRGALSAISQGSAYICKRRNGSPDGKISEHAFGNAIDVMAFQFDEGAPIPVEPREREGTMAEAFQDAVRATACLYFSTVLGPGSDAAHANHLHLDVKTRRGGFRLCQ